MEPKLPLISNKKMHRRFGWVRDDFERPLPTGIHNTCVFPPQNVNYCSITRIPWDITFFCCHM